jgi:tetratricopeptide (TPR) repeat protein
MATLARLLANEDAHEHGGDSARRMLLRNRYYAFLSYSHQDKELADWLHRELEKFRVPHSLAGRLTASGVVPRRLTPIFRDQHDLSASDDLGEEIKAALAASQFLVVLCSPASANSRWTNAEIESFKRTRPEGCVLAAVASGEPFASDMPGREEEECFPPALRFKYDRRGHRTTKRAEPLAADLRGTPEERRTGFLKLVAGMLGVGLDELVQRDTTRRHRQMAWLAAASLGGMTVTSTLAVTAIQARDAARDQRREAEGLVAFMLGDLKDKLEPIGRLDALDGVGSKVLAYYSKQDTSELPDSALLQRSRALSLMAQVAYVRGNVDGAQRLYSEALTGTAEAIRRNPTDPQRLYDHAQNVFWTADIRRQRGQLGEAEAGLREYKRLADRMVALAPDNMKWRMEQQSADTNLGVLLFDQRRFGEATSQFNRAFRNIQALATADPENPDYQKALTESEAWLADGLASQGQLAQAAVIREQHAALLKRLLNQTGDVEYRQKLVTAERNLGNLYAWRGETQKALEHLGASVAYSDALMTLEPTNTRWRGFSARARLNLANVLLTTGQKDAAAAETATACTASARLLAADAKLQAWRAIVRECWDMRARVAAASDNPAQAAAFAERAVTTAKSVKSTDPIEDKFKLAQTFRVLGDARKSLGDVSGASAAWQAAFQALPLDVAEKPNEMAERVMLLRRIGRLDEARQQTSRLAAMGYRNPELPIG